MVKRLKFKESRESKKFLKLDLGAGKGSSTPEGFLPVDLRKSKGVKVVDLRKRWPWKANSIDEVRCYYLLQLLTGPERVHFANELYRVLKVGAKAEIVTPHWCCSKAYGDPHVAWPPVSESWLAPLQKAWREGQNYVDVSGYTCEFDYTLGYGMHPGIITRHQEFQQDKLMWSKEAAQDMIVTLTKRG